MVATFFNKIVAVPQVDKVRTPINVVCKPYLGHQTA